MEMIKFKSASKHFLEVVINIFFLIIAFTTIASCQNHLKNNIKRNEILVGNGFNNYNFFDDQLCLVNFDVSEGSIIRTKDSLALGAKYINVSELGNAKAKDECLRLCCKTSHCNVITFEEKRGGSCYMFDCGAVDNFLCKFTDQGDFMSAILRKRNDQSLVLPQTLSQSENRHEVELSQLRNSETEIRGSSGAVSISTETEQNIGKEKQLNLTQAFDKSDILSVNNNVGSRCSRYQFECKSSGECIGIYNACDGISQCPDGSDEAVELNCPSVNGRLGLGKGQQQIGTSSSSTFQASGVSGDSGSSGSSSMTGKSQPHHSQEFRLTHPSKTQQKFPSSSSGGPGSNYNEHVEKNGNVEPPSLPDTNNNIFNHKDGSLIEESYGNQLQQQRQNNPYNYWKSYDYGTGEIPGGYGQGQSTSHQGGNSPFNNGGNPDVSNMNYGNAQFKFPAYVEMPPPPQPYNVVNSNMQPQQIFPQQQQQQQYYNSHVGVDVKPNLNNSPDAVVPLTKNNNSGHQPTTSEKNTTIKPASAALSTTIGYVVPTMTTLSTTTSHPSYPDFASKKLEDQIIQSLLNKASLPVPQLGAINVSDSESPGAGAILAFVAGLAMSAVMVIIVTCRLRRIRISSRRRGKNRLDPDYLVDGMYL